MTDRTFLITLPHLQELQAFSIMQWYKFSGQSHKAAREKIKRSVLDMNKLPSERVTYRWIQNDERKLPLEYIVIIIWRLQGRSYREIGRKLKIHHTTIKQRVHTLTQSDLPPMIKLNWLKQSSIKPKKIKGEGYRKTATDKPTPRLLIAQLYWAWIAAPHAIRRDPKSALRWLEDQATSGVWDWLLWADFKETARGRPAKNS